MFIELSHEVINIRMQVMLFGGLEVRKQDPKNTEENQSWIFKVMWYLEDVV